MMESKIEKTYIGLLNKIQECKKNSITLALKNGSKTPPLTTTSDGKSIPNRLKIVANA